MPSATKSRAWMAPCARGVLVAGLALAAATILVAAVGAQEAQLPLAQDRPFGFENPPLLYDPVQPAGYPGDLSQPVLDDLHTDDNLPSPENFIETESGDVVPQQFSHITKSKDGFFQKLFLSETYIPRDG